MYPAAWEVHPAPSESECYSFEGNMYNGPQRPSFGTEQRPLLYSAAGVRFDDRPLANGREGGRSRLAAPAFLAAGGYLNSDGVLLSTEILSGSSVAAAVTSAAAALLWSYRPQLRPGEVMKLLYDSGVSLSPDPEGEPVEADYCLHPPCGEVRRISLCGALEWACSGAPGRCNLGALSCEERAAYSGEGPEFQSLLPEMEAQRAPDEISAADMAEGLELLSLCEPASGAKHLRSSESLESYPEVPCPAYQYNRAMPWSSPQPGDNPCPHCWLWDDKVGIYIDPDFDGTLTDAKLVFYDKYGFSLSAYSLEDLGQLQAGDVSYLSEISVDATQAISVSINFLVDGKYSTSSELYWW